MSKKDIRKCERMSAATTATTATSYTITTNASSEASEYLGAHMQSVRELVVCLQDEQDEYLSKLRDLSANDSPPTNPSTPLPPPPPTPPPTPRQSSQKQPTIQERPKPPVRLKRKSATLAGTRNFCNNYIHRNNIMNPTVTRRGALIVLEGLDRVGKSTLAKKLVENLERSMRAVTYFRFPDRTTPVGKLIDDCLKSSSRHIDDHVMHLLFSANRWELAKHIRSSINQGTTVVVDRYSYSGIAYSSAKTDLSLDWCRSMEIGLPRPDLVIYLELPRDVQFKRPGFGEERFETRELQDRVRIQYEEVMDISNETWLKIDVENKSPDQILGEVIMPVRRCLESASSRELESLKFI